MHTQSFDFVFQLREGFLDRLAKASFYGNMYPHYFDYTDQTFRDAGGGARYIFIAPPSVETILTDGDFLKVTLPFRLNRPDDVDLLIDGSLMAEVGLLRTPSTGIPDSIRLDFGQIRLTDVDSVSLQEASEKLKAADVGGMAALIFMLGPTLLDDNGQIDLAAFVKEQLLAFVEEEIGEIDITPALQEVSRVGLPLVSADLKVMDGQTTGWGALGLMLDFAGSSLAGNRQSLSSFFSPTLGSGDFSGGISERVANALLAQGVANGDIPTQFSFENSLLAAPISLSNFAISFLPDTVQLRLDIFTRVKVNYGIYTDIHSVRSGIELNLGIGVESSGRPQLILQSIALPRFRISGFFTGLFKNKVKKAVISALEDKFPDLIQPLISSIGLLHFEWDLPAEIPYRLRVQASNTRVFQGELLIWGNAALIQADNSVFVVPNSFSFPPGPVAYVGMEGKMKKFQTLVSRRTTTFQRPDKTFHIYIPCPTSGVTIPDKYHQLPELHALIAGGTCGAVRFLSHYAQPWSRISKTYSNSFLLAYDAMVQFMPPGNLDYTWYLKEGTKPTRPNGSEKVGGGNRLSYRFPESPVVGRDLQFCKRLILEVTDIFQKRRYASTEVCDAYGETVVTEAPNSTELAVYQRELLLEELAEISVQVEMQVAAGNIPRKMAAPAEAPLIRIEGDLSDLSEVLLPHLPQLAETMESIS